MQIIQDVFVLGTHVTEDMQLGVDVYGGNKTPIAGALKFPLSVTNARQFDSWAAQNTPLTYTDNGNGFITLTDPQVLLKMWASA